MGNGVNNNFNFGNFIKGWAGMCTNFNGILPFLGQTLWQVGPLPWMMNNNFATSIWQGTNIGPCGDFFQSTGNTGGGSAKTKFNKLEKILKDYAATLSGTDKVILETQLDDFKDLKSAEKTQEKYEELFEIYEDYKDKIKEAKIKDAGISENDLDALTDLTFNNIKGKLENNDIIDVINAWNSNDATKGKKLVETMQEKIKNGTSFEQAQYKEVVDNLHNKLKEKAEGLEDDKNLSSDNKKALKNAIEDFVDFEAFESAKYNNAEYAKAFNNLYMATRLAEAEIAQKELQAEFKFLGEDNPFAEEDFVSEVQRDLRTEGLRRAQSVTIPEEDAPENETPPPTSSTPAAGTTPTSSTPAAGTTPTSSTPAAGTTPTTAQTLATNKDDYGLSVGDSLYDELSGISMSFTNSEIMDVINKVNKDNIVGVITGFNKTRQEKASDRYKNDGIIEWLKDDGITIDNCNKIIKSVMERALSAGINAENNEKYKKLQEFFDAKTNSSGELEFHKNTEKYFLEKTPLTATPHGTAPTAIKDKYSPKECEVLDELINALIEDIKIKEQA